MIELQRPNGFAVYVNPDLIETAERDAESGLTTLVLTTGNALVVSDAPEAIAERIVAFRRQIGRPG